MAPSEFTIVSTIVHGVSPNNATQARALLRDSWDLRPPTSPYSGGDCSLDRGGQGPAQRGNKSDFGGAAELQFRCRLWKTALYAVVISGGVCSFTGSDDVTKDARARVQ